MDATLKAFLNSWSIDWWIAFPIALTTLIYVRGWRRLRERGARQFGRRQLFAFVGGAAGLSLALLSPIDPFSSLLLQMHMIQHLLLMLLVPPLLWLSDPELPLLVGMPQPVRRYWVAPLYRSKRVRAVVRFLVKPPIALALFIATTWLWHVPDIYNAALKSNALHNLEHACFFWAAMLFWWPVVQPYPARPRYSRWVVLPYLFVAALQGTVLSGLLSFSDRVLYTHYELVPRIWGVTALDDQAYAGALMWILGMLAYVIPAALIGNQLLFGTRMGIPRQWQAAIPYARTANRHVGSERSPRHPASGSTSPSPKPKSERHRPVAPSHSPNAGRSRTNAPRGRDLLRAPLIGNFLRWHHARPTMHWVLFVAAGLIILDGLLGPQIAPLNLAGVVPWIYWRGFLVLGLLVAGNLFCMACPFKLSRRLGKRWFGARLAWPHLLRSKWLAVALLVLFFWAYESFSLWQSPWWTAWIAVGYFLAAFVIDGFFRGAAFCKYVCPIGQFNFVQSMISPLEVRVRDASVCNTCQSKECIRGVQTEETAIPGCELHLFQPRKSSNMDCTFCLD